MSCSCGLAGRVLKGYVLTGSMLIEYVDMSC